MSIASAGVGDLLKKVVNVKAPPGSPPPVPCYILLIINFYFHTKSYHFYVVFLGIVCKIILKYSKKLLDYKVKNTKTYIIITVTIKIILPMK